MNRNKLNLLVLGIAFCVLLGFQMGMAQEKEAPTQVLITNVNVWDGTSDETVDADVLISGNKIAKVAKGITAPSGAEVIDGKGGTLIPGLLDMHQHLMLHGGTSSGTYEWDAYAQGAQANLMMNRLLYMGYTTLRDIGGNSLSLARAVREGYLTGPRI